MWGSILLAIAALIAGFLLGKVDEYVKRLWARHSRNKSLTALAKTLKPETFVAPTCNWRINGSQATIRTEVELNRVLEEFLFSPLKVMVISGAYGMGKTFVARYL